MQKLLALTRKAINDFGMIEDGDKIAVGVSGGKDSTALLAVLAAYRRFSPQKFQLHAINIDMGFADTDKSQVKAFADWCDDIEVPLTVVGTDIAEIIFERRKESSPCSLCSKMRRGALNNAAIENGCNKLALAHHADDVLGTFLLSLLFEGRLSTFSPVSHMSRTGVTLIRPFVYVEEKYLSGVCRRLSLPVVFNPCPEDKHTGREDVKRMIETAESISPNAKKLMMTALFHPERNNLWKKPE